MDIKRTFMLLVCFLFLDHLSVWAENSTNRADTHAPIGVMADHRHEKDELMLSYRYMLMQMEPNYTDRKETPVEDIIAPGGGFAVSPTEMSMEMHMLGGMYAFSDQMTLMLMLPILVKKMKHRIAAPVATMAGADDTFIAESAGLGDIALGFLSPVLKYGSHSLLFNFGIKFPTGSISAEDKLPVPPPAQERVLPYPMQLGTGSYGLNPLFTYKIQGDLVSFGLQFGGDFPLSRNSEKYRIGKRYKLSPWLSFLAAQAVSLSVRLDWQKWDAIEGADERIQQMTPNGMLLSVPTAQPDLRSGERLDVFLGINLYTQKGPGLDQRLAFEFGMPAYQELKGPQLGSEYTLIIGWQSTIF